jgi:hypothetical protein
MEGEIFSVSYFKDSGLWQLEKTRYQCQTYDEKGESVHFL